MQAAASSPPASSSAAVPGTAALFFIQIFATLGFAVLYSTLVLYATKHLGLGTKEATTLMGVFGAFNYGLHLFGGYLGGRFLSNRNLFVGGMALQVGGCAAIAGGTAALFYVGLALFLTGSGLNVTCINMMLTQRFTSDDPRREGAFLWNYAGMNVGFFVGFTAAGYFQESERYAALFLFATLGNFVAIVLAAFNWQTLADRNTPLLETTPSQFRWRQLAGLGILVGLVPVVWFLLQRPSGTETLIKVMCAVVALALVWLTVHHPDRRERRSRVAEGLGITTESLRTWRRQVRRGAGQVGYRRGRQAARRRAERAGVGGGGAPVACPAPECDQPARHFEKGRRDFCRPKRERFAVIEAMEESYPIADLCAVFGVSRAGFYAWRQRAPSERDRADKTLSEQIGVLFARSRRTYGSPRLHRALRRAGHACGRHRVARLMRGRGLAGRLRGRRRPWTTDSDHAQPIAPNRLGRREVPVERPDEVWVADITYVPTDEGWLYLAGVLDLGSRRVVGWAMGESLETSLPMDALRMALGQRRPKAGLLHHSDRGSQYASEAYREHLAAWGVDPSMSRKGNCYDNAAMESFWSTPKEEPVHRTRFESRAQAASAIFDYLETFYNRARLHSALGYLSPVEFEKHTNLN